MDILLQAARATGKIAPQVFGDWKIDLTDVPPHQIERCGATKITRLLKRIPATIENMHLMDDDGFVDDVVMEDSYRELRKHLEAMKLARGHVLKTGLGLGCFVRGILIKEEVEKVTVVEIDGDIINVIGEEFENNPRVEIVHADALEWQPNDRFDFCWHDIWCPRNDGLTELHAKLIAKFKRHTNKQGAWAFPRYLHKLSHNPTDGGA